VSSKSDSSTHIDETDNSNPTNSSAVAGIKNFATLLANRYSSTVGCTRSWNSAAPQFLVIMDNMMNLEVFALFAQFRCQLDLNWCMDKVVVQGSGTNWEPNID
jgi:hypothetical protein